jgi:hypothetical protein
MKTITIVCNTESGDLMVHWPNGRLEWIGLRSFLKLVWWAAKNGVNVTLLDAKGGESGERNG